MTVSAKRNPLKSILSYNNLRKVRTVLPPSAESTEFEMLGPTVTPDFVLKTLIIR